MELDFSKCKTAKDVEQVFADHKEEIATFQKAVGSLLDAEGE